MLAVETENGKGGVALGGGVSEDEVLLGPEVSLVAEPLETVTRMRRKGERSVLGMSKSESAEMTLLQHGMISEGR